MFFSRLDSNDSGIYGDDKLDTIIETQAPSYDPEVYPSLSLVMFENSFPHGVPSIDSTVSDPFVQVVDQSKRSKRSKHDIEGRRFPTVKVSSRSDRPRYGDGLEILFGRHVEF